MSHRVWIAIALLAFTYSLWPSLPASAGYGVIAWDKDTGKYGVSWNQQTPKRAEKVALGECGTSGCKIVQKITPKTCGALAMTADGKHVGAARRKDRAEARVAALDNCKKDNAGECVIRADDCNR